MVRRQWESDLRNILIKIQEMKHGKIEPEMVDVRNLFQLFHQTVENAADLIHQIGHRRG